jgi:DNA-binding transcriptional LysR family regulator
LNLDELRVFVEVIEKGSLAAAARSLRFPVASLRRRLDELEARLGVKLLERSRHGAMATSAGTLLVDRARKVLHDVRELSETVREVSGEPAGEVGLALPHGMPPAMLGTFFQLTLELYPSVTWRLHCVDDPQKALLTEVHAAVCFADDAPRGPFEVRHLMRVRERLLASPAYLAAQGIPSDMKQLAAHRLLMWEGPGRPGTRLPVKNGTLDVRPAVRMGDIFGLRQIAARGAGIVFAPDAGVPSDEISGDEGLVPVLEAQVSGSIGVWLVANPTSWRSPRLQLAFEQISRLMSDLQP